MRERCLVPVSTSTVAPSEVHTHADSSPSPDGSGCDSHVTVALPGGSTGSIPTLRFSVLFGPRTHLSYTHLKGRPAPPGSGIASIANPGGFDESSGRWGRPRNHRPLGVGGRRVEGADGDAVDDHVAVEEVPLAIVTGALAGLRFVSSRWRLEDGGMVAMAAGCGAWVRKRAKASSMATRTCGPFGTADTQGQQSSTATRDGRLTGNSPGCFVRRWQSTAT